MIKSYTFLTLVIILPLISPTIGYEHTEFSLEIANTPDEREKGLMNRENLSEDHGMLFMYEEEDDRSFWMKNTTIPLDIIFMDSDMEIINIEQADPEPNTSDSNLESYRSEEPAQYVLEINQNKSKEIGLEKEEKMDLGLRFSGLE